MPTDSFVAFDLGAESGRALLGTLEDGLLRMKEVHRFPNSPINVLGHLQWDVFRLFEELKVGLKAALAAALTAPQDQPCSIGIDTWGVDFALLGEDGMFLGLPFAYRDKRTDGMLEELFRLVPRREVYKYTGIQFQQFNTLVQLLAMKRSRSTALDSARHLLFIPDALTYMFSGVRCSEFTFATTSQLMDPRSGSWVPELFRAIGVDPEIMQRIVQPGTVLGPLAPDPARECGAAPLSVVAVGSHDTASAVASVPATDGRWAYISSGTWSLLGVELPHPVITDEGLEGNFTNEGGVGGKIRFLKNLVGLWLLQECRRAWGLQPGYEDLMKLAAAAEPFRSFVNPDDHRFYRPESMPAEIAAYCSATGQRVPESQGEFARCILESLAMKYREAIDQLTGVLGHSLDRLHIIGGGSRNRVLCQYAANVTGLPVVAGPVEGTAIGNLLVQAMAAGILPSLSACREVVKRSFELTEYLPVDRDRWEEAYARFRKIIF